MTSIKQQMEDARTVQLLWEALIPKRQAPAMERILLWVGTFNEAVIEHGVRRAAAKFYRDGTMTADDCARYATSVMRNESAERKAQCNAV